MIDLRSDTVTKPTPEMRQAMAEAEVGDDVYGEDPTVNRLQEKAAELMGKEAALFTASGTMANLLAFLSQTRPGDTVILAEEAHPFHYESGNLAMIGGLMTRTIPDPLGKITPEQIAERINLVDDAHFSHTTLAAIENTVNRGGGVYYSYEEAEAIGALCHQRGLRLHCDGARIFNASAASNLEPRYLVQHCDTVCFCLSKGLGAPVGSLLCGNRDTLHRAHRFRKMLGGGMRQAGILAAAGLYALEHHVDDLREDHRRAREFRRALEAAGARFPLPSPTNIVFVAAPEARAAAAKLAELGVRVNANDRGYLRAVFHRDITDADLEQAVEAFKKVLTG
jgi:threonine aldolase